MLCLCLAYFHISNLKYLPQDIKIPEWIRVKATAIHSWSTKWPASFVMNASPDGSPLPLVPTECK